MFELWLMRGRTSPAIAYISIAQYFGNHIKNRRFLFLNFCLSSYSVHIISYRFLRDVNSHRSSRKLCFLHICSLFLSHLLVLSFWFIRFLTHPFSPSTSHSNEWNWGFLLYFLLFIRYSISYINYAIPKMIWFNEKKRSLLCLLLFLASISWYSQKYMNI